MHIIDQATQRLGVPASQAPTNFATASLRELAEALDALAQNAQSGDLAPVSLVAGAAPWARAFAVDLDELRLPARTSRQENGRWQVFAAGDSPLAEPLLRALEGGKVGSGVLVVPPGGLRGGAPGAGAARSARRPWPARRAPGSSLVQHGPRRGRAGQDPATGGPAPAHHDRPRARRGRRRSAGWWPRSAATTRFAEALLRRRRACGGCRPCGRCRCGSLVRHCRSTAPTCCWSPAAARASPPSARWRSPATPAPSWPCSAAPTRRTTRSWPRTCAGWPTPGLPCATPGPTSPTPVRCARRVAELEAALGPVTAVLHGAGRNEPGGDARRSTWPRSGAPSPRRSTGCATCWPPSTRDGCACWSRSAASSAGPGLRGEAHYATANDWLAELTREVGERNPDCRAICMEWSVWSGVGMGERLSVVEGLARKGIIADLSRAGRGHHAAAGRRPGHRPPSW